MFRKVKIVFGYLLFTSLFTACGGSDNDNGPDPTPIPTPDPVVTTYEVQLKANQQVPMAESMQEASATVSITDDEMLSATMDLSSVSNVSAAHIHSGEVGTNGAVVFAFADADADGTWEIESESITPEQHAALLAGNMYINVHTTDFADGEIRGQVVTETQSVHVFTLAGEQEVPSVDTSASGQGYLLYDSANGSITLNVWAWNVEATAAHIHNAQAGINGAVAVALESSGTDGMWQTADGTMLTSNEATALTSAMLYVNVHSSENPNGEIRGQILPEDYALILFPLSPWQEVPQVSSDASGMAYATLNTASGALMLNAWATGMTATAAHIHQAEIGVNGGVAIALEENMDTSGLWQTPANTALDSDTQTILLAGGHYVNVHSEAFPSGEIRGQIVGAPWEVMAFALSGNQEVPSVTTEAEGDGYALVNTQTGALTMRILTSNLDTASAAHIHAATAGVNGDVVVGLEQDATDMSVWMTPANTMLDSATLATFLDAGHYVNVHTPTNASGEIRGQILSADTLMFPLMLSGNNSVPVVDTLATGEGAFTLNTTTGSLRGAFTTTNIVSNAAHIHEGAAGQNGGVVIALEATTEGYKVPDETILTSEQMSTMTSGNYYVNVHSVAFPSGEMRAQVTVQ